MAGRRATGTQDYGSRDKMRASPEGAMTMRFCGFLLGLLLLSPSIASSVELDPKAVVFKLPDQIP
jgi:hypothetical protein